MITCLTTTKHLSAIPIPFFFCRRFCAAHDLRAHLAWYVCAAQTVTMFYSQGILAKKESPLSKIWLAAHWSKKLSKQDVFNADIEKGADAIMKPMDQGKEIPMALRVSGHLLVGLCRIYQRKVSVVHDCSDALTR